MNSEFELPIYYLENKEKLDSNIINDLELLALNEDTEQNDGEERRLDQTSQDNVNRKCLMETVIQPKSKIGKEQLHKLCEYYTNNKLFLKQTQKIIGSWKSDDKSFSKQKQYDEFYELWQKIKGDDKFIDRYYYVDVDFFKFLNHVQNQ